MTHEEILDVVQPLVAPFGLRAEIFQGSYTNRVGVQGDGRFYGPVVNLIGPTLLHPELAALSNRITNAVPVAGVTFECGKDFIDQYASRVEN